MSDEEEAEYWRKLGRLNAIAVAWANAPQKAFEDDYMAFAEWVESTLTPILAPVTGSPGMSDACHLDV